MKVKEIHGIGCSINIKETPDGTVVTAIASMDESGHFALSEAVDRWGKCKVYYDEEKKKYDCTNIACTLKCCLESEEWDGETWYYCQCKKECD